MEVSLRCHNTPRQNGWRGAGDVTHRKRAEVRVRIGRKSESGIRRQTRRIDFWSSQTRSELTPYGGRSKRGPLEMGANWIRQHRRLCFSSLRRNLSFKVNKKVSYLNKKSLRVFEFRDSYVLYMFYRYEHLMSISPILHLAIFVYMAM